MSGPTCSSQRFPLEPAHPVVARDSTLFVAGDRFTYPALERIETGFTHFVTAADLDAALKTSRAASAQWRSSASESSELRIAILGTSSAAGCGAAEDVRGAGKEDSRRPGSDLFRFDKWGRLTAGLDQTCLIERSWGRHLADYLSRHLPSASPTVHIAAKNAVPASFFSRCTSRHLYSNPHVVLLDVLTNFFDGNDQTLVSLVEAVRRAAPTAAIAFVMWPSQYQLKSGVRSGKVQKMLAAAAQTGVDALRVDLVLRVLSSRGLALSIGERGPFKLYAQRNADQVHPSPLGHQLLGAIAARFVAKRLADAACQKHAHEPSASPGLSEAPLLWERCFDVADRMPVQLSGSWRLVDEGGAKGVRKLGYLSTAVGDTLRIGPLQGPPSLSCALLRVTLGYKLSASRSGQGKFNVTCTGCSCARMHSRQERYDFYPFPYVDTDAREARNSDVLKANATITAETEFFLLWRPMCFLDVLHLERERTPMQRRNRPTRIRIDSLSLTQTDQELLSEVRSSAKPSTEPIKRIRALRVYRLLNQSIECAENS